MRREALWDRGSDEIHNDLIRLRANKRVVSSLCSYLDDGVTKHAIVAQPGDVEQRIEPDVPAAQAPYVIARHAREGFHPALIGMVGSAASPEITILLARTPPGAIPPRLVLPLPFRDDEGRFFAARIAASGLGDGLLVSLAAAGAPIEARGTGLVIAGVWAPQPATRVTWAVHLDAMRSAGDAWRDREEVRTLEAAARPIAAIPIASGSGARWVLSLWHDRAMEPWPSPDPFARAPRFEVDEATTKGALARVIERRGRDEDRSVIAIGAGSGFLAIHGSRGRGADLERRVAIAAIGDAPPTSATIDGDRDDEPDHPLDRWALAHMRETGARHGQIVVVRGRRLAFARAYTWAEAGYPTATLDRALRLGSVSKALTTIALLATLRRLGLDVGARVVDLLGLSPDEGPPALRAVTIRHLLTHTAGLATFPDVRHDEPKNPLSEARIGEILRGATGAAAPGDLTRALARMRDDTAFARRPGEASPDYSNEGFILLGEVLSKLVTGRADAYGEAMMEALFRPAGIEPSARGCLFRAGQEHACLRGESPAHPSSPTWARDRFAGGAPQSPLTLAPYADNGPFLGGAAGLSVPLVWIARALAALGPRGDGAGLWSAEDAEIAATPAAPGSNVGHGFHLGEPGFWTFRPSGGGAPLTVRVEKLHHNGRLDGGAALLVHLMPHDARENGDATLSLVAAFNQLGPLYEDPHGKRLLGILRALEGSQGWDADLFGLNHRA